MSKKAALHTLGCRLNQAETAVIAKNLQNRGFEIVPFGEPADLTVVNTCTVTEQADSKCRQAVRKSIRSNPETFVAVIGCYAQMGVEVIKEIEGVDLIVGNEHKMQLADYVETIDKMNQPQVIHSPKISRKEFTIESVGLFDNNTRANLKIQDGCNFVCSFCIIAKARGPARSRAYSDIMAEAEKLVTMGHKELVITGVNVGTYASGAHNFLSVLKGLDKIDGLERIRISSIEPTTIGKEVVDLMATSDKICPYLHIPLQSGDDRILDSMRRKHSAQFFKEFIEYAVEKIPHIGLGTDVMVGYPTEDKAAFENTKILLADLPISYYHVFTYSDRKGTTSYKLKPKVNPAEKKARYQQLTEQGKRKKALFYQSFIGTVQSVLFEEQKLAGWTGYTGNFLKVIVKDINDVHNKVKNVKITGYEKDHLIGELV